MPQQAKKEQQNGSRQRRESLFYLWLMPARLNDFSRSGGGPLVFKQFLCSGDFSFAIGIPMEGSFLLIVQKK